MNEARPVVLVVGATGGARGASSSRPPPTRGSNRGRWPAIPTGRVSCSLEPKSSEVIWSSRPPSPTR
jgi:hypothetical protein